MVVETKIKPRIRDKPSPAAVTLGEVPSIIGKVPGPGYDTRPQWKGRGGVIAAVGHRDVNNEKLTKARDHALAFRTLHSNLVRRSCNSKVRKSQDARVL
jgi:hypothetical protein